MCVCLCFVCMFVFRILLVCDFQVVATEPVSLHSISAHYLSILFSLDPALGGRFYHYLATILAVRRGRREQHRLAVSPPATER
jgi:hypothetical protein